MHHFGSAGSNALTHLQRYDCTICASQCHMGHHSEQNFKCQC